MSDSDTDAELEELREQRLQELQRGGRAPDGAEAAEGDADGGSAAPDEPVHLEDTEGYEAFVGSHDVVLVDFYADWCGPCKMLEPIVADLARETDAAVLKVDIDRNQGLAARNNIQGVPTMYLYADGQAVERMVGVQDKTTLANLVAQHGG